MYFCDTTSLGAAHECIAASVTGDSLLTALPGEESYEKHARHHIDITTDLSIQFAPDVATFPGKQLIAIQVSLANILSSRRGYFRMWHIPLRGLHLLH